MFRIHLSLLLCAQVFQSEPVERVKAEASKAADKVADAAGGGGGGISLPKVNLPSGGGGPTLSQLTLPRESFVA
jgi:hypothetical protein